MHPLIWGLRDHLAEELPFFLTGMKDIPMKTIVLLLFFLAPLTASALTVADLQMTTAIKDHSPVDKVAIYPAQNGKLYCYSRIEGAQEATGIEHLWFYEGKEMARVRLPIRSLNWRTYSSKKILSQWKGRWQVRVLSDAGDELAATNFIVQ